MPADKPGCLLAFFRLLGFRPSAPDELPFRLQDEFLSPAELLFYRSLFVAVGDLAVICPKVRVGDILYVIDRKMNMGHANRIERKHVDFLLCDPEGMQPLGVVELDDSSHDREDRSARDQMLDEAYAAAGLAVLHVKARRSYKVDELATQLRPMLARRSM
ncbi:MAG: DUF2726 domain-containing protein [Planctomycetota bacterium]|nr:DUF2726 domain-containing protein [Planctomycetota bacterium]